MPTIILRRFTGGINANVAPHELGDDQFVELKNLMPGMDSISPRPTLVQYLGSLGAEIQGMTEYHWGPGRSVGIQLVGPLYANIVEVDNSVGTSAWTNHSAARYSDDLRARAEPDVADGTPRRSFRLVWRDFRFNVPSNAQIVGVLVEFERHWKREVDGWSLFVRDAEVLLRPAPGTHSPQNKAGQREWALGVDRWDAYGGDQDLWGLTPTPTQVNSGDFAVVLSVDLNGVTISSGSEEFGGIQTIVYRALAFVDACRVTVYYRVLDPSSSLFGQELLIKARRRLFTDRTGTWSQVNTGTGQDMSERGRLRAAAWQNVLYLQDGETGPWRYLGASGTFELWTGGTNPPPVASFIMLDRERLYLAAVAGDPNQVRASTIDQPGDWPMVARPGSSTGMALWVGKDDGDFITGLVRFSGTKIILKRRSVWALYGDDADTWQLRRLFNVGAESDEAWADIGFAAAWSDGERIYLWDGTSVNPEFGLPVERYLRTAPGPRKLCWVHGRLLVWYDANRLVLWDSRWRSWFGPWEGVPASAFLVRRDAGTLWVGSSDGLVGHLTGSGAVDWALESKHHQFGREWWEHMVRRIYLRGERTGRVRWSVRDGSRMLATGEVTLDLLSQLAIPVARRGRFAGLRLEGYSGAGARLYEIGLEAEPVRLLAREEVV